MQKWQKINEHNPKTLPPYGLEVLIYIPSYLDSICGQHTAWLESSDHFISNMNIGLKIPVKVVTHWQPLPQEPQV